MGLPTGLFECSYNMATAISQKELSEDRDTERQRERDIECIMALTWPQKCCAITLVVLLITQTDSDIICEGTI